MVAEDTNTPQKEIEDCFVVTTPAQHTHLSAPHTSWVVDGSATATMTPFKHLLADYTRSTNGQKDLIGSDRIDVEGYGSIAFIGTNGKISKVLHVPDLYCHLYRQRCNFGVHWLSRRHQRQESRHLSPSRYKSAVISRSSVRLRQPHASHTVRTRRPIEEKR